MPTYQYRCGECGAAIELLQSVQAMRKSRDTLRCQRCEGRMQFVFPSPALSTNTTFMANRDDGFGNDDNARRRRYAEARRNGVSTAGKVWSPQLNTWHGGKDDVKRICEERNLECTGLVNHRAHEVEPEEEKRYVVAPDIVQREVERITDEHGYEMSAGELKRLPDETRQRLSGRQD